jgi:methionyl-tRNA formyltransferase
MKVVFVFNDFPLHNHIIEEYLRRCPRDSAALVKVPLILKGKGRSASAARIFPQLSKRFMLNKLEEHLGVTLLARLPRWLGGPSHFKRLAMIARDHRLPMHVTPNIMSEETLAFIRGEEPDVVVCMFHQIVKGDLIRIPRLGVVNIHPGILPDFRGIQPYFWELSEGAGQGGVTIHLIENQEIDTGRILAETSYPLTAGMSVTMNYYQSALGAASLLPSTLELLESGRLEPRAQAAGAGRYFRWPDSAAVDRLRAAGHSMMSFGDLLQIAYGRSELGKDARKTYYAKGAG